MSYRIKNFLFRLVHPAFWFQNYPSDASLDLLLNSLMDAGAPVTKVDCYEIKLGGTVVWVRNWPYAYGRASVDGKTIPYPLTRLRLRKYIAHKAVAEQAEKIREAA